MLKRLFKVSWLIYKMSNSSMTLGLYTFLSMFPSFALTPFAGIWADRENRRKMLLWTQCLSLLQATVLAALVYYQVITIPLLFFLGIFLGIVSAIDMPIRHSFVIEIVEQKADLGNAIALNSAVVNLARLLGPSLAGLLIATVGESICFSLNAMTYLISIATLFLITPKAVQILKRPINVVSNLKEGFIYAYEHPVIRSTLLLLALISLIGLPYTVLMPIFARDILHGGPHTLGLLMGASGGGALLGALWLAQRQNQDSLLKLIPYSGVLFGVGLMIFSYSLNFYFSFVVIFLSSIALMIQLAGTNTIVQIRVDDDKRGRVMSIYTMAFLGMYPFGGLINGTLAKWLGAPATVFLGGGLCVMGSLFLQRFIVKRRLG